LIEIVSSRYASLLCRLCKRIEYAPTQALLFNAPFAASLPSLKDLEIVERRRM
jgi:hypothetical protein